MANNDSTKRVPLELLCMLILKEGDRYGYEMVQEIESRSGGLLSFNLDAARARMRVYYHLEPAAEAYLTEQKEEYRRTAVGVQNVLKSCEVQHEKEA